MARLILLLLVVTLSALVTCAPQYRYPALIANFEDDSSSSYSSSSEELHRLVRSPHHDGTDHDHEAEEKTDQDHEHPVLTGDAKKGSIGGDVLAKPRVTRDTTKEDKEKEGDHSATTTKDKDAEDDKPEHLKLKEDTKLIGGGRVVRESPTQKPTPAPIQSANAPGPFLLQGAPIHTHLSPTADSSSGEEKSSEEQTKTKRDVKQDLPLSDPNHPARATQPKHQSVPLSDPSHPATQHKRETGQNDLPLVYYTGATPPQQEPRPPQEDAQSSKHKRDTSDPKLGGPLSSHSQVHTKTEDGRDASIALPQTPGGPQNPKHKRDTSDPKLDGPLSSHYQVHAKTKDGRDASIALPQTPGGPQSPKHKRDTSDPKLGGPLSSHSQVHAKTDDGRDASIALPQTPGGPQSPKHKRDTSDHKVGPPGPLSSHSQVHAKTEDGRDASIALPQTPGGPQSPKHKRDTSDGKAPTLGGPLSPTSEVHIKTEDGRDASISLPQTPGGPQSPKHKRDTGGYKAPTSNPYPTLGGPLSPPSQVHIKTEDGRGGTIALPQTPGGPQHHKRDTSDVKPVSPTTPVHIKTQDGKNAAYSFPRVSSGPVSPKQKRDTSQQPQQHSHDVHKTDQKLAVLASSQVPSAGPQKHKRETTKSEDNKKSEEKPSTLTKEVKDEEDDVKKEAHKQKRDSYSVDHKDDTPDVPLHEQPETKDVKLSPPTHESEYNRHVRDTVKDSTKLAETHHEPTKSAEHHDDSKSKSSEEKKGA